MISFIRWQHNTEWIGRKKMELMEAIAKRESVRSYEDRPVPEEKLLKVLEAARLAPSASNRQRYKFIVVRDAERRRQLSRATGGQRHVAQAPVVIAAVSTMPEYVMRCEVPAYPVDLAIAVDHMTLDWRFLSERGRGRAGCAGRLQNCDLASPRLSATGKAGKNPQVTGRDSLL
jgi:nitroreductase